MGYNDKRKLIVKNNTLMGEYECMQTVYSICEDEQPSMYVHRIYMYKNIIREIEIIVSRKEMNKLVDTAAVTRQNIGHIGTRVEWEDEFL